ncbi:MAG TPA: MBL fold metallo-hydrolase [Gammaproteobacteria bacterium]|nr:MBL fold metallo-hydrolase [Gammaproteobacteria bacterium]
MKVRFFGAAGTVTGSCFALEAGGRTVLLDCGQFQGTRQEETRNRTPLPLDVSAIDAVVLSHAHIDHSGRLPLLRKQGYAGPVYAHHASVALSEIMLRDAAYLHEKDAGWENRRRQRRGWPLVEPLYTRADAEAVLAQFRGVPYGEAFEVAPGITVRLHDAGHILGAAIVQVDLAERGTRRRLVFSGDLGVAGAPLMNAPTRLEDADRVLLESTYGNRNHRSHEATLAELKSILHDAARAGGNVVIPAFAVGRTQDLLRLLAEHYDDWDVGRWRVYLDSPMAIDANEIYNAYGRLFSGTSKSGAPLALPNLVVSRTTEESMQINAVEGGAIIIAGSGMCAGGRIRHHLKHNLWREQCHVIIVGFQARGTLGRRLVDGAEEVRIFQETIRVAARVHTVGGLSAHADQSGLLDWYGAFRSRPPVCLVHGEPTAQHALAAALRARYGVEARVPRAGSALRLD